MQFSKLNSRYSTRALAGLLITVGISAGMFSLTSLQGDLRGRRQPQADLSVRAVPTLEFAKPGMAASFTVTARNDGPDAARKAKVTIVFDSGVSVQSDALERNCKLQPKDMQVTCSLGTLETGAERIITMPVLMKQETACDTQTAISSAVTTDTVDPQAGNNTFTASLPIRCEAAADLQTTTVADVEKTSPNGRLVHYTVTITNNGPDPTAADTVLRLEKQSDDGQDLRLYTGDETPGCNGEQCSIPPGLSAGASATVTFIGFFPNVPEDCGKQAVTGVMMVPVTDQTRDPISTNNDSHAEVSIDCSTAADVSVSLQAASETVPRNERITFSVAAKNVGPDTAENLQIITKPAGGTSFVFSEFEERCRQLGTSANAVCTFGSLEPDQQMTVELPVTVSENADCSIDLTTDADARTAAVDNENSDNNHAQASIRCE